MIIGARIIANNDKESFFDKKQIRKNLIDVKKIPFKEKPFYRSDDAKGEEAYQLI